MILFPNKFAFIGTRDYDLSMPFWGTQFNPQKFNIGINEKTNIFLSHDKGTNILIKKIT